MTYVSAGTGHRRAAEALAQTLAAAHPSSHVECRDLLDDAPGWFRIGYAGTYLFLVRHFPWAWKWSYHLSDLTLMYRCVQPVRHLWNLWMARRFIQRLKADPPDAVITTHFFPADICSAGKRAGWLRSRLIVVVTDVHPHWFWISPEVDAMVVSTPAAVTLCERRGIARSRVHLMGIPIHPSFARPLDREMLRRQLGIASGRAVVLVTSGGTTIGRFERVVHAIRRLEQEVPGRLQLLVVCGHATDVRERLTRVPLDHQMPMKVFGFIDQMAELMAASDLVVAKAGGLTISEAMVRGLPLILYHVIPGQEQMNANYLVQHGAAIVAQSPEQVAVAIRACLSEPQRLAAMRHATTHMRRPDAAEAIAQRVIQLLVHPTERMVRS